MLEASLREVIMNSTLFEIIDPKIREHPDSIGGGDVLPVSAALGKDGERPYYNCI